MALSSALTIWSWISTILVLLGAELNAEIEHQTARDPTVGDEKPWACVRRGNGRHRGRQTNPSNGGVAVDVSRISFSPSTPGQILLASGNWRI